MQVSIINFIVAFVFWDIAKPKIKVFWQTCVVESFYRESARFPPYHWRFKFFSFFDKGCREARKLKTHHWNYAQRRWVKNKKLTTVFIGPHHEDCGKVVND